MVMAIILANQTKEQGEVEGNGRCRKNIKSMASIYQRSHLRLLQGFNQLQAKVS
jgi:hypothetical protein